MSNTTMKTGNTVNGFVFRNAAEAEQAKKEADGVTYICDKVNMDEPEMVLQIYNKMIQQRLFETAVGFAYLKELQEYLETIPFINNEDILPIIVQHPVLEENLAKRSKASKTAEKPKILNGDYKKKFHVAAFISGILTVCIIAMFVITATTNNATILNYESQLIDKYEHWEQELLDRETAISEKEEELGIGQD